MNKMLQKIYLKAKQQGLFELLLLAILLFSARSAIADWNWVPTPSMLPTIQEGELVWVNKLAYDLKIPFTTIHLAQWDNPQRGDIVVFYQPETGRRLIKRVIGLPGDRIVMRAEQLIINNQPLAYGAMQQQSQEWIFQESLSKQHIHQIRVEPYQPALRNFGPITVGSNEYFMLGDNRDNSGDSRFFGLVPRDSIVGKANRVLISFDVHSYYKPRFSRFFATLI